MQNITNKSKRNGAAHHPIIKGVSCTMIDRVKLIAQISLFLILGPGMVAYYLLNGESIIATFWALPVVAIIWAFLSPGRGPGHFALTHEFGPIQESHESMRSYHMKMAKWWGLGSLTLPLTFGIAYFVQKYQGFSVILVFSGFMLGIPCFLKMLGSLFKASRSA